MEESKIGVEDPAPDVEEKKRQKNEQHCRMSTFWILAAVFNHRTAIMKGVPKFLRGLFRNAMKSALKETTAGRGAAVSWMEALPDAAAHVASQKSRRWSDLEEQIWRPDSQWSAVAVGVI